MTVSGPAWIERFAERLGVDAPRAADVDTLLDLAGLSAHASERMAAPISCWMAAQAGISPSQARTIAQSLIQEMDAQATS